MKCPKCKREMKNYGHIDNVVMCSDPPCWYETWACAKCKLKHGELVRQKAIYDSDCSFLNDFKDVSIKGEKTC